MTPCTRRTRPSFNACILAAVLLLSPLAAGNASARAFDKVLKLEGVTFHVTCPNDSSLNNLLIVPGGLKGDNAVINRKEIDGSVTGAEVADLNNDGSPELYIYVNSAGSGSYGSLIAYSADNKKSLSEIYLPPLEDDVENSRGYMGHDQFSVVKTTLVRRFPIYKDSDSNANPTGGTRRLEYKLIAGEAGWQLKLIKSSTL